MDKASFKLAMGAARVPLLPVYVGYTGNYAACPFSLNTPTFEVGDLLILITYAELSSFTTPSGWTSRFSGSTQGGYFGLFTKIATLSDTSVTVSGPPAGAGVIFIYRNVSYSLLELGNVSASATSVNTYPKTMTAAGKRIAVFCYLPMTSIATDTGLENIFYVSAYSSIRGYVSSYVSGTVIPATTLTMASAVKMLSFNIFLNEV
jgi:hypothetical protein